MIKVLKRKKKKRFVKSFAWLVLLYGCERMMRKANEQRFQGTRVVVLEDNEMSAIV